jgi:S-adenosylmethionine uptake transporter
MSAETLPELSATPSSGRSNRRAAGIAVLAFAVFSVADALIKLLAIDLPAPQIRLITTIVVADVAACGEASVVAPFQYSQIIWGCLYGALLFAAPVNPYTIAGALIIILSGWLVLK